MENIRNWLIILMLPVFFYSSSALALFDENLNQACEKSSGSTIKVYPGDSNPFRQAGNPNNAGDQCSEVPDAYRITIYKFGACKQDPFLSKDFSTCEYFIDSPTPVVHTIIGIGSPQPLATTGSIAPGTYSYGFMILSNSLEVKHTQTYDTEMSSAPNGTAVKTGTTCWSIDYTTTFGGLLPLHAGKGTTTNTGIECGLASDAQPEFTKEIFDTMGDGGYVAIDPGEFTLPSGDKMRAMLLTQDNETTSPSAADAARIFARIDFANDKVVTESSSFEIKFKLTDAVSLDSGWNGFNNFMVKMGADPFQVEIVVTN